MSVRVLVVDDEPDVETLFRQQFRREVGSGQYTQHRRSSACRIPKLKDNLRNGDQIGH
jgi:hypothetical protein